jgi:hypothetical protein
MKWSWIIYIAAIILFSASTCEKDEPINPDPDTRDCVLTKKALRVGTSPTVREDEVFEYNSSDQLVEITKTEYEGSPNYVRRWKLTYDGDQLETIKEYSNGDLWRTYTFQYAGNLPDTVRFADNPGPYTGLYALAYTGNQLSGLHRWGFEASDTLALDTIELDWNNANVIHMIRFNDASVFEEIWYEYDSKRSAEANLGWSIVDPLDFADLSANNLIRMTRQFGPNTVVSTWDITKYNDYDYPLECTWTTDQWAGEGYIEFTYDCF